MEEGGWARRRKTRRPGWTSLAEIRAKPPVSLRSSIWAAVEGAAVGGAESGVVCLVEGGEPGVKEAAGGRVGDEADLVAEAGQADHDRGMDGADVIAAAGGHGGVGGVAKDDGVDLVGVVVFVVRVGGRCGAGGSAGGTGIGAAGGAVGVRGVSQGEEDRGERGGGGEDGEQDGGGTERLATGEVKGWSGADGRSGGLVHGEMVLEGAGSAAARVGCSLL